jgi:hypothetical protein
VEGSIVVQKVRENNCADEFNAETVAYENLMNVGMGDMNPTSRASRIGVSRADSPCTPWR